MAEWSLSSFESPERHAAIADIVRRRSINQTDVRQVALEGLDLSAARTILDLGCGFGFMTEAIARRVAPEARIVGLDACLANQEPYLDRVAGTSRTGCFVYRRLDSQLDWPADSFDVVVCSYSLYFFPGIIPEVARVLAPDGVFVALTHREESCRDLLRAIGARQIDSQVLPVSRGFSAENGTRLLTPWFAEVERVEYRNALAFEAAQRDELLTYLRFKLPFLSDGAEVPSELPEPLTRVIEASLARQGRVVLAKNDAAFRCRKPRCR